MTPVNTQENAGNSLKTAKNDLFFCCEMVNKARLGYKAGYNYTSDSQVSVNLFISKKWTEADLMLFYELKGSGINFGRNECARLIIYTVKKIDINHLNLICYEFNK